MTESSMQNQVPQPPPSAQPVQSLQSITLQRLLSEDAPGQLQRRDGRMAQLGSEDGVLKLDWVDGATRLLASNVWLEEIEAEAQALWKRGIRYILWTGMGGSIITVRVLVEMGFGRDRQAQFLFPLDSTDPASLNEVVRSLAQLKQLPPLTTTADAADSTYIHALLQDVLMIGVSMGMTSEEPITHLEWFTELLQQAQLHPSQHLLIMTLPNSYLDLFAQRHQVPTLPLQLDGGTGTGGRMSAPATRVFLLPAALYLTRSGYAVGTLRQVFQHAQHNNTFTAGVEPFIQLAAALSDASQHGACQMRLVLPESISPLVQWIEQLMEESLGKHMKGIVVFHEQALNAQGRNYSTDGTLNVHVVSDATDALQSPQRLQTPQTLQTLQTLQNSQDLQDEDVHNVTLQAPYLSSLTSQEPLDKLAALITSFTGWQRTMAFYGYLQDITFAGQPAVENYKTRARALRNTPDPLQELPGLPVQDDAHTTHLRLYLPNNTAASQNAAALFASALVQSKQRPRYFDCTFNGVAAPEVQAVLERYVPLLGNTLLGIPVKLRVAPAAYHSTEQSEMDGPPDFVSLRLLTRSHETCLLGHYEDRFLCAQAISTWQAMIEQGRQCYFLLIDGNETEAAHALEMFFEDVIQQVQAQSDR